MAKKPVRKRRRKPRKRKKPIVIVRCTCPECNPGYPVGDRLFEQPAAPSTTTCAEGKQR